MKKTVCNLLVLSILSITVPGWAAESGSTKMQAPESLRAAIAQSGLRLAQMPAAPEPAAVKAQVPMTMPRSSSDRIRKQGGHGIGMAIGLVTTLAGLGATIYMVKQMQKNTDKTTGK
jgi:hypothetical protein